MASVKIFLVNIKNWAVYKIFSIKNIFQLLRKMPLFIYFVLHNTVIPQNEDKLNFYTTGQIKFQSNE